MNIFLSLNGCQGEIINIFFIQRDVDVKQSVSFFNSKRCQSQTMNIFLYSKGRQGEIMHLYRSFAFLMSRMMTENGGYFVCRTRHLVMAGSARV